MSRVAIRVDAEASVNIALEYFFFNRDLERIIPNVVGSSDERLLPCFYFERYRRKYEMNMVVMVTVKEDD